MDGPGKAGESDQPSDDKKCGRWPVPANWEWVALGELTNVVGGGTPKNAKQPDNYTPKGIPWITPADLTGYTETFISKGARNLSDKGFANSSAKLMPTGTVLFSSRAPIGYCAIASNEICTNQGFKSFPPSQVFQAEYLRYYLLASKSYAESLASGTTFSELSGAKVASIMFPLPPLAEQRRIVARIDALFAKVDAGLAALEAALADVGRYRKALLKAAVTGALTQDWRAENAPEPGEGDDGAALLERILVEREAAWEAAELAKLKAKGKPEPATPAAVAKFRARYKPPAPPKTDDLPDLPNGWVWATVEQVGLVQLGRQRSPKNHDGPDMRPYLRVANVFEDRIDTADIYQMNFTPEEFERYKLEYGDILLNEGQSAELVGRPAIYRGEVDGACFTNTLVRFRPWAPLGNSFFLLLFKYFMHFRQFQKIAKITTNIAHLGADRFARLPIPLPPLAEQGEIVSRVEAALAKADALEATLTAQIKAAKALKQSILKSAFTGQLVPQDPADEPAAQMLRRIKAQA
ncbi:MAG: restriction endonuclease subunit S [Pseudomonadota bacterium]